jgi:hypothetical protein
MTREKPVSKIVWAAWNGILANTSVPGNIIHVRSLKSWLPHVAHTSFTNGRCSGPPISFIIDSNGDWTLVFVVRAFFLSAVSASLVPFLTLSFSTSYNFIVEISNPPYAHKETLCIYLCVFLSVYICVHTHIGWVQVHT